MRGFTSVLVAFFLAGCGDPPNPFAPVPECTGAPIQPLQGDRRMVISSMQIADFAEGFDLDKDGRPDNKMATLGAILNAELNNAFDRSYEVTIPIEVFGYKGEASTSCTKLGFYLGRYVQDRDGDGRNTNGKSGDCDDTDPNVRQGLAEVPGNRIDDDCDGYADNMTKGARPADTMDLDGDGYSLMQGDCDDRSDPAHLSLAMARHPGALDTCGDGIDQDCDGVADNDPTCHPLRDNNVEVDIERSSLDAAMKPLIQFTSGTVTDHLLEAGPGLFRLAIPADLGDVGSIALELDGVRVRGTLVEDLTGKTSVKDGLLGGVLSIRSLALVKGFDAEGFIKKEQSLADAVFVGPIGVVLGLETDKDQHYLSDMDVDGDGVETFWQEVPSATPIIDTCRDGDGTIIKSGFDGMGTSCLLAKDAAGKLRFVDGLSMAFRFSAVPVRFGAVVE